MCGQLKYLYLRELAASANYTEIKQALEEARASLNLPLQGFLLQPGAATGYFADGWAGPHLTFAFTSTRPAKRLALDFYAPAQLTGPQILDIDIDGQTHQLEIAPATVKRFELAGNWVPGVTCRVSIRAASHFIPAQLGESGDARELCFRWVEGGVE